MCIYLNRRIERERGGEFGSGENGIADTMPRAANAGCGCEVDGGESVKNVTEKIVADCVDGGDCFSAPIAHFNRFRFQALDPSYRCLKLVLYG